MGSPQTVTFDSFLSNFNNQDRPGGGSGVLDLDSGIFTCFTSGYYTVSFSSWMNTGAPYGYQRMYLYRNGVQLPESYWFYGAAFDVYFGGTGARNVILHMNAGDTLELRITEGDHIGRITL